MKSWNEIRKAATTFSKRWKNAYDGYELTLSSGIAFCHVKQRNAYRRERIQSVSNACGEVTRVFSYGYDALDRPTSRTLTGPASPVASSFSYNSRGEVTSAVIGDHDEAHEYDFAGNSITASCNSFTNEYVANSLNQYTSVGRRAPTPPPATMLTHDIDGNLTNCTPWSFTWDSGNRLATVSSNGVQIAAYAYDTFGRRVKKTTADTTTHFFYDGWNLVREVEMRVTETNVVEYVWGKDLSGSFQGAGGVGGLLYERRNGAIYIPFQDAFGNIMGYWDTNGVIVAEYTYDAFGRTIAQSGSMADVFRHRFSTKYYDSETGFYYYGYRYYFPELRRWLSRDPLEEEGGNNLYVFCMNAAICNIDPLGRKILIHQDNMIVRDDISNSARGLFTPYAKIDIKCSWCGVLTVSGSVYRKIKILTPDHGRWEHRHSNYKRWGLPRTNIIEWKLAYSHEMDHWNSFNAFFDFVRLLNDFDGTSLYGLCEQMRYELEKQKNIMWNEAIHRSERYDTTGLNAGGMYPKDRYP